MSALDPRIHPFRPDLAAESLRGRVEAPRYVTGVRRQVSSRCEVVRGVPSEAAGAVTQLIHGEVVAVYEDRDGWAWGQSETDGYVGFVASADLAHDVIEPTHRIAAIRTLVFAEPDYKSPVVGELGFQSRITLAVERDGYAELARGGWIVSRHAMALDRFEPDYLATAHRFVETPYRWGGRSGFGIDCSGLVQACLAHAGLGVPRDSDMQAAGLGDELPGDASPRPGDFVFWPGHVAMLVDAATVIHAASTPLKVCVEPLAAAAERNRPEVCRRRLR